MYLPILDLRMVTLITDADDQLLAVGISMPSLAEALQKAHGRLLPMGWYHLAKTIFLKKYPKMLDLLLVAVKPEYQNKGVGRNDIGAAHSGADGGGHIAVDYLDLTHYSSSFTGCISMAPFLHSWAQMPQPLQ